MIIATHDGTFHADETTACAILTYLNENATIIRSRDENTLESGDLVIDVSSQNDDRHFDHHSKDFTLCRDNGIKYATAGLMWMHYGREFLQKTANDAKLSYADDSIIEAAFKRIDSEVMEMIDLNDNGQLTRYTEELAEAKTQDEARIVTSLNEFYLKSPDLPYLVSMMNLPNITKEEQDKNFLKTVKILKTLLIATAINALNTEYGIKKVLECYSGGPLLIMHEKLPWSSAVFNHEEFFKDCMLAVYPDRNGRWRVQSLPVSKAKRFENRISAPLAFRGLNDEDLDEATGLKNTTFVHKSGFTGGAKTFEDNLALAKLWLKLGLKA